MYVLNNVLRNSVEIASVIQKVRETCAEESSEGETTVMGNITTGHNIHSNNVIHHKLNKWTGILVDAANAFNRLGGADLATLSTGDVTISFISHPYAQE